MADTLTYQIVPSAVLLCPAQITKTKLLKIKLKDDMIIAGLLNKMRETRISKGVTRTLWHYHQ